MTIVKVIVGAIAALIAATSLYVSIFLVGWSIYKRDWRWIVLAVVVYLVGTGCQIVYEKLAEDGMTAMIKKLGGDD